MNEAKTGSCTPVKRLSTRVRATPQRIIFSVSPWCKIESNAKRQLSNGANHE